MEPMSAMCHPQISSLPTMRRLRRGAVKGRLWSGDGRERASGRSGGAEAVSSASRRAGSVALFDPGLKHRGDDKLGDAHAARDGKIVLAQIDQQNLHLAAIVAVDRSG